MATGIVITVAENVVAVLLSQELKEICSMFGYKLQLEELHSTVLTIKSVLLDAESKHQELTHAGRDYIERLKDAVYDVDDLLDEFNTMVQKQKNKMGGKVSKKVRRFFSRSNKFLVAFNMTHDIKNLRSKLDKIANDRQQFGLSDVYVPLKRREETMSFASDDNIIGRETDKESIVGMLLGDSESSNDVGFLTIVGIGGLGKTALAQLVYNDPRIEKAFELRLWVCVSDDFSWEKIFRQILGKDGSTIEGLQREVRTLLQGKKYLLVLDDVWNENRHEWNDLKSFLNLGGKGSRVVVTSRSKKVASVVGDDLMYELRGLTDENSWKLFKRLAFKQGKEPMNNDDPLFDIGKKIVKKCANVPLSIRVAGSMLYDQDDSLWQSLSSANLMEIGQGDDGVMPILKYSYYHLSPALKSCFSYCALFPKDFTIEKKFLIRLWLAHGCLENPHDCRSEEDVGEEYFSILLHRCFLQDAEKNFPGDRQCYKMHDLIHDLALKVGGKETIILDYREGQFDKKSRHLSLTPNGFYLLDNDSTQLREMKSLRTLITAPRNVFIKTQSLSPLTVSTISRYLRRLRVLSFRGFECETLPDTLGNLLQLRYLDLSENRRLKVLPNSITELINLLVLNLDNTGVIELPLDMKKLVNLRQLSLYCVWLTHMPPGLDTLPSLHMLTKFVLGNETSNQGKIGQLRDLKALVNLRDSLTIKFSVNFNFDVAEYEEVELLRLTPLKCLKLFFYNKRKTNHEILLGCLQPHCRLSKFFISGYKGFKLPTWTVSLTISLPHLVSIHLEDFDCLEILPSLSHLQHLKCLELKNISNVEYVENDRLVIPLGNQSVFFPSLEELKLIRLPKLKGWWREETSKLVIGEACTFPRLCKLVLESCPNLISFPSCPKLLSVELSKCPKLVTVLACNAATKFVLCLKELKVDNVGGLDSLFAEHLERVHELSIECFEGETLPNFLVQIASSIEKLDIRFCCNLKSVSGVAEHLTNLKSLRISNCENLKLENSQLVTVAPWKSLHMLSSLSLYSLPKLLNLPDEFRYLTSLVHLYLDFCENLEALPEWLECLTSLQTLKIFRCPKLKSLPEAISHMPSLRSLVLRSCSEDLTKRCQKPDGEDWPKICRIPHLVL